MSYLPIVGYEGLYEVNELGSVRSVHRIIKRKDGISYPFKERLLRQSAHKDLKYFQVSLWKNNIGTSFYVHRLVAITHIQNPNNLPEVNHKDGNRQNNSVSNLEWCTNLKNIRHAINTGLKKYTNKLTREEFVECLVEVINGESYLALTKRVPYKVPFLSVKLRKIAAELGWESELNESLYRQRVERARINGAKNTR